VNHFSCANHRLTDSIYVGHTEAVKPPLEIEQLWSRKGKAPNVRGHVLKGKFGTHQWLNNRESSAWITQTMLFLLPILIQWKAYRKIKVKICNKCSVGKKE